MGACGMTGRSWTAPIEELRDILRQQRLELALLRDSMLTEQEQIAMLDVYAEFARDAT